MKRTDVDSSMLASVGYDEKKQILEVEFNHGGIYEYYEVEKEIYDDLMNSDSLGRYFINHIKGDYDYGKVRKKR